MKKLVILLLIVAVGASAYKLLSSSSAEIEQLEFVPADTPVFSAQLEAVDMKTYLASLGIYPAQLEDFKTLMEGDGTNEPSAAALFAMQLLEDYIGALNTPEEFSNITGFKNELRSMLYMVGISPVLQVELSDPAKFLALFSRAQEKSGIEYALKNVEGFDYHSYVLDAEQGVAILVRTSGDWGVVTLHDPRFDDAHLSTSLAITKPTQNIINSDIFDTMRNDYGLKERSLGFISAKQIGLAFTTRDGNALASDLNLVIPEHITSDLDVMRSPECKADIDMLTDTWPGIFMGSDIKTTAEGETSYVGTTMIPTTSTIAIDNLKAMRGFLPSYATGGISKSIFSMGLGTDVANLSRSVNNIWTALVKLDVNCAPIVALQQQISEKNPTGAFAMAGMANGLMGMGVAINKLDMSAMQEGSMDVDAIVSISAKDVRTLYASVQTFAPMLSAINLPNDGDELVLNEALPMLDQFGVKVMVMASEGQLIVYSGEIAREQAVNTLTQAPEKNGLIAFGMDYKAFVDQMLPLIAMSGQPIPPELEAMMDTDITMSFTSDVNDVGIVLKADMKFAAK